MGFRRYMDFVPSVLFIIGLVVCAAGGLEAARATDYPLIQDLGLATLANVSVGLLIT